MGFVGQHLKLRILALAVGSGLALTGPAAANPSGPTVRHGQVNYSPGSQAQVQQLTDRAIVDWQSFSIGQTESLVFLQPSQFSVILNRVTGGDPSAILGSLSANGNIFLINPNGILFGPDSVVSVGGLVASTLSITDEDFLASNYSFFSDQSANLGAVVNQGRIKIADGGYAVLTGPAVMNEGIILARSGSVTLAAGEKATLNLDGRDLVHFALDRSVGEGTVLLAPGVLSDTLAHALGVNPELRADHLIRESDGSVRMVSSSGTLVQAGTVSTDGRAGQNAGTILLDSTDVTILANGSVTTASGRGADSNGGQIRVLSDMTGDVSHGFTDVQTGALISATGGQSGDGGFIEVSGRRLNLHGTADLSAPNGTAGALLLDPQTYMVIDGDDPLTTVGDLITVGDQWFNTLTGASLAITSTGNVLFDLSIDGTNPSNDGIVSFLNMSGNRVNLTITSGSDPAPGGIIDFGDDATTFRGLNSLTINSDDGVQFGDSTIEVNGPLSLTSLGDVDLGTSTIDINAASGNRPLSIVVGNTVDAMAPLANLDFGDAQITVDDGVGASGTNGLLINVTGNIDLGSSDLTYLENRGGAPATYDDQITAGGNIFSSAAPDGDPGNFLNNWSITGDTGPLTITAGGSIVLTDLRLDVNETDGNRSRVTKIDANGGDLNLGSSVITVEDALTLESSGDILLNQASISTEFGGDLDIDAVGSVTMQNATLDSRGFLHIAGDAGVSLGSSTLNVTTTGEERPFTITAGDMTAVLLDLGSAQITVSDTGGGGAGSTHGLLLTSTGNIDFGSSDLTFLDDRAGGATYADLITAGGNIFSSAAPDGDPGNFLNNWVITGDTGPLNITAGGSIELTDLRLDVNEFDGNRSRVTKIDANGGDLNLGSSLITVEDALTLESSADIILLNDASITTEFGGDLDIDATGSVTMQNATLNSAGFLHIAGDAGVSLGSSTINVISSGEVNPLAITAGDMDPVLLDLGSAQMTVTNTSGATGAHGLLLSSTGDLDFGSSNLTFSDDRGGGGGDSYLDLITAGGDIFSSVAADGDPGTFVNNYVITGDSGDTLFQAGGDIRLPDISLLTNELDGDPRNLILSAPSGEIFLGESSIVAQDGDARLQSFGLLDVGSASFNALDQLVLSSTSGTSANGSRFMAGDIEILGFDSGTMTVGGAVNGDVRLDLAVTTSVDLTVLATGDIEIHNNGGGTIVPDAIGGVSLSSTTGNVKVVTDGNIVGSAGLEISAAGTAEVVAANIGNGPVVEVQGESVILDTSSTAGSIINVDIIGDSSFLSVKSNGSSVQVDEINSGNSLDFSGSELTFSGLGMEDILFSNVGSVELDNINIGTGQSVGVSALAGDITPTSTGTTIVEGALALEATGSVGLDVNPVRVSGGTVAANAGNEVFLESDGDVLTVGTVSFPNDPDSPQKSVSGVRATNDVEVRLISVSSTQLVQQADIESVNGGVALDIVNGSLVQDAGTVRAGDVAIKANGNVGEFDGSAILSEVSVEAARLVLDVGGDSIIHQTSGNLALSDQVVVGGDTYTSTGAGGDLRIRNSGGDVRLDTDLSSGGEAALVAGNNLTVNQGGLPNNIVLNGSLTTPNSLVIVAGGDITQISGTLTSPQIGLGAGGVIGTAANPISLSTDQLSVNPFDAQVNDSDGFVSVSSVTAAGVTVNQGLPPQPNPSPGPEPGPGPEPLPGEIPSSAFGPTVDFIPSEFEGQGNPFAADNAEMVEEILAILQQVEVDELIEEDPTRPPTLWPEEDFLQRKFRR